MYLEKFKEIADNHNRNIVDNYEMRLSVIRKYNEKINSKRAKKVLSYSNASFIAVVIILAVITTAFASFIRNKSNNNGTPLAGVSTVRPIEGIIESENTNTPIPTPVPSIAQSSPSPTKKVVQTTPTNTDHFVEDLNEYDPENYPLEAFDVNDLIPNDSKYQPFDYNDYLNKTEMKEGIFYYDTSAVLVIFKYDKTNFDNTDILNSYNMKATITTGNWRHNKFLYVEIPDKSKNGVINAIKILQRDKNVCTVRLNQSHPEPANY